MKSSRHKKVLGLAVGERSLLIAELASSAGGRPQVRQLAEMTYPAGVTLEQPSALGQALAEFLRDRRFSARVAVVGLPAKWVVARAKALPAAADSAAKSGIMRLAAEAEFSADVKDLALDYLESGQGGADSTALLLGTRRGSIDAVGAIARAAKIRAVAMLPSAIALGAATTKEPAAGDALVLAVGPTGAELTAQRAGCPYAIRHLRTAGSQPLFVSELRLALSSLPPAKSSRRMVLWNGQGFDTAAIGSQVGLAVQHADLSALGVAAPEAARNGAGQTYAAAVALALLGLRGGQPPIDFLHSRLEAPRAGRVPRWAMLAAAAAVLLIGAGIYAYANLQRNQADLDQLRARLDGMKDRISVAEAFVSRVSFAQGWYGGQPRYIACLRDLKASVPDDGQTYATSLILREPARPTAAAASGKPSRPAESGMLTGQVYGKTSDQQHVQIVLDRMNRMPGFANVKMGGTQDVGRGREVSFSVTFDYLPSRASPPAPAGK